MSNYLKSLYDIQQVLLRKGYLDTSRISKEILDFSGLEKSPIQNILKRIEKDEPWEYIKGSTIFCQNEFVVNKRTLIPRVESEELVNIATNLLLEGEYGGVIDVGTGSGCIIISLCKNLCEKNNLKFFATDIKKVTLEIAKQNSVLHKVNERITFIQTNLIKDLNINYNSLIVANLPYIPTNMYKKLDKSVKNYEPRISLDGGLDGLKYYKQLLEQIKQKNITSKYKITLLIEIEPSTLNNLDKLLQTKYDVVKDFRGLNRFVLIHLS